MYRKREPKRKKTREKKGKKEKRVKDNDITCDEKIYEHAKVK
jgi:hypothetical protein